MEFDSNGKACGLTSARETVKCKKIVCDPSYLPDKVITFSVSKLVYFFYLMLLITIKLLLYLLMIAIGSKGR